jgi:hypothetical protein
MIKENLEAIHFVMRSAATLKTIQTENRNLKDSEQLIRSKFHWNR